MGAKFKAWITKYALTSGIECVDAEIVNVEGRMIMYNDRGSSHDYAHGNDWHSTRERAIKRALDMRRAKISSLDKKIAKLIAMTFEDTPYGNDN